jgi:hypothetical protein
MSRPKTVGTGYPSLFAAGLLREANGGCPKGGGRV